MLGGDAVPQPAPLQRPLQGRGKLAHLPIEGHVGHLKPGVGCRGRATVRHALDLHEARQASLHQRCVAFHLVLDVEALHQRQAEHGPVAVALLAEDVQTSLEALTKVSVEGPVDPAQGLLVRRVDRHVQLRDCLQ